MEENEKALLPGRCCCCCCCCCCCPKAKIIMAARQAADMLFRLTMDIHVSTLLMLLPFLYNYTTLSLTRFHIIVLYLSFPIHLSTRMPPRPKSNRPRLAFGTRLSANSVVEEAVVVVVAEERPRRHGRRRHMAAAAAATTTTTKTMINKKKKKECLVSMGIYIFFSARNMIAACLFESTTGAWPFRHNLS
jgi:hypothetical protein